MRLAKGNTDTNCLLCNLSGFKNMRVFLELAFYQIYFPDVKFKNHFPLLTFFHITTAEWLLSEDCFMSHGILSHSRLMKCVGTSLWEKSSIFIQHFLTSFQENVRASFGQAWLIFIAQSEMLGLIAASFATVKIRRNPLESVELQSCK